MSSIASGRFDKAPSGVLSLPHSAGTGKMVRVADKIIEVLAQRGVRHIFTVSGGGAMFLDDALAVSTEVEYICCHHEQAVAIASEAYARVRGGIGVSVVTTGPGGTNAISGVAGSWMDSVPHLILSGQVYLSQTMGGSGLRQMGVQEINIIDLVRPITKYAVMVEDAKEAIYHVEKAIHAATTGRPGPVWVDIPVNIQNARVLEEDLIRFDPVEAPPPRYDGDLSQKVHQVVGWLQSAKRPLVHFGQGVKIAGALELLMQLVERYRIPFVTARNANQFVDWDHELYVGRPGTFAQRGANFAVQNADVYIAVGTRLSLPQTGYNSKDFARHATKVMVDIDKAELEKKTLAIDLTIHADAKAFLSEMLRQLDGASLRTQAWVSQCRSWKEKYPVVLPEHRAQRSPVNSYYFVDVLSDVLTREDVVVTDMGIAFQGTHQAFRVKKGQKFFTNSGFASMGWGLPAAIGACMAHDRKRVVCIAGEGGLQMTIQELATVMHHRLPIKLFVYNNGGYLTIKQSQEIGCGGRLMGCNKDSGISFPDLLKMGAAYGIPSVRIDSQENLKSRIEEIVNREGPVLCELVMDPDQPQISRAIPRYLPDGTSQQTAFEDLHPFLDREELKENMVAEREEETRSFE